MVVTVDLVNDVKLIIWKGLWICTAVVFCSKASGTASKMAWILMSSMCYSVNFYSYNNTHRMAHSHYLVARIETHAACGLSQSMQPLGLWHFCFPGLPLALSDSDGVSNKQSLSLATSAQLKTTGIVKRAFVYRNLQVSIDPAAFSTFFLSLPLLYC